MKKTALILCAFLLVTGLAFAHPPSDIKIQFDPSVKVVVATVIHHVNNPKTHYIKKIDIGLNGKEVQTLTFTKQDSATEQSIAIPLPEAKAGDTLSVEGYCNLSGELEKEIKI